MMAALAGPNRSKEKLVRIYSAANEMEARMIQEVLAGAGIESTIEAEFAPGIYPSTIGDWARQYILVLESSVAEAGRILSELQGSASGDSESEPDD
jgi:putative signal transducing protein